MNGAQTVGLIDNLVQIDHLITSEGYEAPSQRYMEAVGGNTGNLAFVYGTRKCIADKIVRVGWGWVPTQVRSSASILVISCANQIGAHADLGGWAAAIEKIDLPVVLLGLGAQTTNYEGEVKIPEGTLRFLAEVDKRRPGSGSNIAVRGDYTKGVLKGLGFDSEAIGCPSLYISPQRNLGRTIVARSQSRDVSKVAVAAGNPFHVGNREIESKMIAICNRYRGAYVVQHPEVMVSLALDDIALPEQKVQVIAGALGFGEMDECREWFRRNAYSFHDTQTWMHFLRHYDVTIGARYHGVALSVQAGTPGLVLHIDNRTRELSIHTAIPSIGVADVLDSNPDQLVELARWGDKEGEAFDANRAKRAIWMASFLSANGVNPSDHLLSLSAAD